MLDFIFTFSLAFICCTLNFCLAAIFHRNKEDRALRSLRDYFLLTGLIYLWLAFNDFLALTNFPNFATSLIRARIARSVAAVAAVQLVVRILKK